MIKKVLATVMLILITSVLVAGCISSSNTPTQTPSQASNVGNGLEIYATPVANPPQMTPIGHITPKPGNVYVAFNCTLKDINAQPASGASQYNSGGWWNLVDRGGHIYDSTVPTAIMKGTPGITTFEDRYMNPGDVINGYVFFEVPSGSTFNYIHYFDRTGQLEIPL